jgi:hypothetical protein
MIINALQCWSNAKISHDKYFNLVVIAGREKNRARLTHGVYDFLVDNHDLIRDGSESDFRALQAQYEIVFSSIPALQAAIVDAAVREIFDYSTFARKCKKRWCAYKLCEHLEIKTCPYCNLTNEVTFFAVRKGVVRPAIDHFFDKATYPLYALSLGNFVPSCHHCNSTFKGALDFYKNLHLNPLRHRESISIELDVDPIDARSDISLFDKANVNLIFNKKSARQANSVRTFYIVEQYQARIDEIRKIAVNIMSYSASGDQDPDRLGWVLRNVTKANYRNQIFGKMILDLSNKYL